MIVLVPYVGVVHPLVLRAAEGDGWEVRPVELTGGPADYCDLLAGLGSVGQAVAVVEHDVLPWPGALAQLAACPHAWCGYSYAPGRHFRVPTLGCVRFSAAFLAAICGDLGPDLWGAAELPRTWQYLDQELAAAAKARGLSWHQHYPAVLHAGNFGGEW